MPTPTYDLIATTILAATSSSVLFNSIPQTYRDLVLVSTADGSTNELSIILNGDTGANYSRVVAYGPSPISFAQTGNTAVLVGVNTTNFIPQITQIMDYSATDKHKIILNRGATSVVAMSTLRWASNSAITTMLLSAGSGNFASGSRFSLYGIVS